jgi:hypothetical protein
VVHSLCALLPAVQTVHASQYALHHGAAACWCYWSHGFFSLLLMLLALLSWSHRFISMLLLFDCSPMGSSHLLLLLLLLALLCGCR